MNSSSKKRRPALWPWILFVFATLVANLFLDPLFRLLDLVGVTTVGTLAFASIWGLMVGEFCLATVICGLWGRHWLTGYVAATCLATVGWLALAAGQVFWHLWEYHVYDGALFAGALTVPPFIFLSSLTLLAFRVFSGWRLTRALQAPHHVSLSIADMIVCTAFIAALIMFSRTTWALVDWPLETLYRPISVFAPTSCLVSLIAVVPAIWILFRRENRIGMMLGGLVAIVCFSAGAIVVAINQYAGPARYPVLLVIASAIICVAAAFGYTVAGARLLQIAGFRLHTRSDSKSANEDEIDVETTFQRWAAPVGVFGFFVLIQLISWGFSSNHEAQAAKMRQLQRDMASRGGCLEDFDGDVVSITLGPGASRADIQGMLEYPRLQQLKLAGAKFEDGDLQLLMPLTKLQSLDLSRTSLTDAGLETLASWSNIHTLSVAGTKCTAAGLKKFVERHPIYQLDIGHLNLTDSDVNAIATAITATTPAAPGRGRVASQIRLVLAGNPITNDGLAFLKNSMHTWSLDLTDCNVDEGGLSANSYMELTLDGTLVDLAFARRAKTLGVFSELSMDRTEVTDAVLPSLGSGMIHHLKLGDTQVTEEGLSGLGMNGLRGLSLNSKKFTGKCFASWLPNLNVLDMSHSGVSDAEIKYIVGLTGVYDLNLSDTEVTDACLATLAGSNIHTINLSATRVTAMGLAKQDWQRKPISIAADQFTEPEFKMLLKHHRFNVVPPVVKKE